MSAEEGALKDESEKDIGYRHRSDVSVRCWTWSNWWIDNEVEPPQPLGIGIDGGYMSIIECIQGRMPYARLLRQVVIQERWEHLIKSLWITTMMTEYVYGVTT